MKQLQFDDGDSSIKLNQMLKVEVIVSGEDQELVTGMMLESGVTGYTIFNNVSGYGHGGSHEARLLFNDKANQIMIMAVAPESVVSNIARGLRSLLDGKSGVMFVSEVSVARLTYFS